MFRKFALLLIAGMAFSQATGGESKRSPKPYDVAKAYEVYSALLTLHPPEGELMIATATVPFQGCLDSHNKSIASAIADYRKTNKTAWQLQPKFDLGRNYRLLSQKEIDTLRQPDPAGGFFWRFPDGVSIIHLSAVGFSGDKTIAFVGMDSACGGQCGDGGPFVFQNRNGKWLKYDPPPVKNSDGTFQFESICGWSY
jgi:hypothetical protein